MKKLQIVIFLIGFPIILLSQEKNKFQISDSFVSVKKMLIDEFGDEMEQRIEKLALIDSSTSFGILEMENILNKVTNEENEEYLRLPGACYCYKINDTMVISNSIGLMAGILSIIHINLSDSIFFSKIIHNTDGGKTHKLSEGSDFIEDIEVDLIESTLSISGNSEFKPQGMIRGQLHGTTIKYYEVDYSPKGYREIQIRVESIFECKVEDISHLNLELGNTKKN